VILAAGLTPAWQQILSFDRFQPGEVNRALVVHWCASGKVLNVGIAGHWLGEQFRTLAMIGGRGGEEIKREFADAEIDARWIETETPTRVCTTILDQSTDVTTELVEESGVPTEQVLAEFDAAYSEESQDADIVVLSGSLPPGVPMDFYRKLLERTSCRVVLDIRGPELLEALPYRPFLVKPNREELGKTFGRDLSNDDDAAAAVRQTIEMGADWVVLTDGSRPVIIGFDGGLFRASPPEDLNVVNPIGCGDCLAAGIAVALEGGRTPINAICFGMAAAIDNLGQLLPARIDRGRVEAVARWIKPERI
jgi:1-phosphofructokinase family hexose kinase